MENAAQGTATVPVDEKKPESPPVSSTPEKNKSKISLVAALVGVGVLVALVVFGIQLWGRNGVEKKQRIDVTGAKSGTAVTISMQGQWKGEDKRENYILETIQEY